MTKKIILKVALQDPLYDAYITGLVTGGGKHMIDSSQTAQLEGFTLFKQRVPEFNFITCLTEPVIKITKQTTFWTQDGIAVTGQEGKDLKPDVDLFALQNMFGSKRGPADPKSFYCTDKKTHIRTRVDAFLEQDGVNVLEIETQESSIHRKHINGRPLTFNLIDGIPQVLHKSGDALIDSRFLWGLDPVTIPLKELMAYDLEAEDFWQEDFI